MSKYSDLYAIIWNEIETKGSFERNLDWWWTYFKGWGTNDIQRRIIGLLNRNKKRKMDVKVTVISAIVSSTFVQKPKIIITKQ